MLKVAEAKRNPVLRSSAAGKAQDLSAARRACLESSTKSWASAKWNFRNPSAAVPGVLYRLSVYHVSWHGTTSFVSVQSGAHFVDGLRKPAVTA